MDVSRVTNFSFLFSSLNFNGDVSRWDVSRAERMDYMFANSSFCGDLFSWKVSKVAFMTGMFQNSPFNGDLSQWDVSRVKDFGFMFSDTPMHQDLSLWNLASCLRQDRPFTSMFTLESYMTHFRERRQLVDVVDGYGLGVSAHPNLPGQVVL